MNRYDFLLLDADDTLLDFAACEKAGLTAAFADHGLVYGGALKQVYKTHNTALWQLFETGGITKENLQVERFARTFLELGISLDPADFNRAYTRLLGQGDYAFPGVGVTLAALKELAVLVLVTNGVGETQRRRMENAGLDGYFAHTFVSDDTPGHKPHMEFFDYVFAQIPGFEKDRALLCGDSLTSDILGAQNAGIDSCWYNPRHLAAQGISPTWEIDRLEALVDIVQGAEKEIKPI